MKWNADFEIASAVFQLVLLIFFLLRKYMPTRQNRVFMSLAMVSTITVIMDVIASVVTSYPEVTGYTVIMVVNVIYFSFVPILSFLFLVYVIIITGRAAFFKSPYFLFFIIPSVMSLLLALSNPVTGFLFYLDENMVYHRGAGYLLQIIVNMLYLVVALLFVFVFGKNMRRMERNIMYCFGGFMTLGVILQGIFFKNLLLTNAMTALSLVLMYMAMQNPDSYVDKSTGLYNRDAFLRLADEYLQEGKRFSCIGISVRNTNTSFAQSNYENFEVAVLEVARYLNRIFDRNLIFRIGTSSFIVLEWDKGNYERIVEAVLQRGKKPFAGKTDDVELAMKVTVLPYWYVPGDVVRLASYLTYAAGEIHENGVLEVDESIIRVMEKKDNIKRVLEKAIQDESVQLYLQPVYSERAGRFVSVETLARIFDENTGFISPEKFIGFYEANGDMPRLGIQIFEKVCQFIKEADPKSYGYKNVRTNISIKQLMTEDVIDALINLTDKYNVSRSFIELEIREQVTGEEDEIVYKNLEYLKAAGFKLTIEGYGAGSSNLKRIIDSPFETVKIDKSVLWAYYNQDVRMMPDIVRIFNGHGLNIIASGVENEKMHKLVSELGIDLRQGFLYSKPVPVNEFGKFANNNYKIS